MMNSIVQYAVIFSAPWMGGFLAMFVAYSVRGMMGSKGAMRAELRRVVVVSGQIVAGLIMVWIVAAWQYKKGVQLSEFLPQLNTVSIGYTFVLAILGYAGMFGLNKIFSLKKRTRLKQYSQEVADERKRAWVGFSIAPDYLPLSLTLALTAALFEEFGYRWYVQYNLTTSLNSWGLALLVTAALFAFAHFRYGFHTVVFTFSVGIFLGGIFAISNSVISVVLAHSVYNVHAVLRYTRTQMENRRYA